jgi:hypothetical protein
MAKALVYELHFDEAHYTIIDDEGVVITNDVAYWSPTEMPASYAAIQANAVGPVIAAVGTYEYTIVEADILWPAAPAV